MSELSRRAFLGSLGVAAVTAAAPALAAATLPSGDRWFESESVNTMNRIETGAHWNFGYGQPIRHFRKDGVNWYEAGEPYFNVSFDHRMYCDVRLCDVGHFIVPGDCHYDDLIMAGVRAYCLNVADDDVLAKFYPGCTRPGWDDPNVRGFASFLRAARRINWLVTRDAQPAKMLYDPFGRVVLLDRVKPADGKPVVVLHSGAVLRSRGSFNLKAAHPGGLTVREGT